MDSHEANRRIGYRQRIEAHFRAQPNVWIVAAELMPIGGLMAWRTRCADARKVFRAEGGDLENRVYYIDNVPHSEYRYLPIARQGRDSTTPEPTSFTSSYQTNERLF